jgi:hypothetical protein
MINPHIKNMGRVINEITDERFRQEKLRVEGRFAHTCADPDVDEGYKMCVLIEEVGEVGRALMEKMGKIGDRHNKDLRKELIQVAAVAMAWAESLTD